MVVHLGEEWKRDSFIDHHTYNRPASQWWLPILFVLKQKTIKQLHIYIYNCLFIQYIRENYRKQTKFNARNQREHIAELGFAERKRKNPPLLQEGLNTPKMPQSSLTTFRQVPHNGTPCTTSAPGEWGSPGETRKTTTTTTAPRGYINTPERSLVLALAPRHRPLWLTIKLKIEEHIKVKGEANTNTQTPSLSSLLKPLASELQSPAADCCATRAPSSALASAFAVDLILHISALA